MLGWFDTTVKEDSVLSYSFLRTSSDGVTKVCLSLNDKVNF